MNLFSRILLLLAFGSLTTINTSFAASVQKIGENVYQYHHTRIVVLRNSDITDKKDLAGLDCIVNAANKYLAHGGGIARAISDTAGPLLQDESNEIIKSNGPLAIGSACFTKPYYYQQLGIQKIVHTVGPDTRVPAQNTNKASLLYQAYKSTLSCATSSYILPACKKIGIPAISTAIFGYDITQATPIAIRAMLNFIDRNPEKLDEIRIFLQKDYDYAVYTRELDLQARVWHWTDIFYRPTLIKDIVLNNIWRKITAPFIPQRPLEKNKCVAQNIIALSPDHAKKHIPQLETIINHFDITQPTAQEAQNLCDQYCRKFKAKLLPQDYTLLQNLVLRIIKGATQNDIKKIIAQPEYQYRYASIEEYKKDDDKRWEFKRCVAWIDAFISNQPVLTQTEGILFDTDMRSQICREQMYAQIRQQDNRSSVDQLITQTMQQERQHQSSFVFYHTTGSAGYLMAYFDTQLLRKLSSNISPTFLRLRQPYRNMYLMQSRKEAQEIRQILLEQDKNRYKKVKAIQDIDSSFGYFSILCANPSLLGGFESSAVSSLYYFFNNVSKNMYKPDLFINTFKLPSFFMSRLNTIVTRDYNGPMLLQLFLTPEAVNKCVYNSEALYTFNKRTVRIGAQQNDYLSPYVDTQKMLEALKADPSMIDNSGYRFANDFQQRIILSVDFLLNPPIGSQHMQVHRYSHDETALKQAEQEIDQIVDEIYQELQKNPQRLAEVREAMLNFGLKKPTSMPARL